MPTFAYRARDPQGVLIRGEMEAVGVEELKALLSDRGLIPISAKKQSPGLDGAFLREFFQQKIKKEEILVMTRQFYTLFKAGMGMEGVLGTLVRQTPNKRLREILLRIRSNVSAGESLSKSFAHHRGVFGDAYVSMLEAGEEAGILESVLERLNDLLEKELAISTSIKSATLYPKIVIFVLVAASLVIINFVMPKFQTFYGEHDTLLPLPTRILIGMSDFVRDRSYLLILGAVGAFLAYRKYSKTARGRLNIGALRFRIPVFGALNIKVAGSRFCHILSAMYRSGLPMTRCLEITGGTIGNDAFMREVEFLKFEVTQGRTMSGGMASCKYFTPIIVDSTAVGEKTGALDDILEAMGNHYDLEVHHTVKNLMTLLEPLLLFVLFGMVALFMLAIFMPMWNLSGVAATGVH